MISQDQLDSAAGGAEPLAVKRHCVLLVEDNPDDARLATTALRSNRIINEVVVARDGEEATDYLFGTGSFEGRDALQCPELVLLDLKLPGMNGLDLLRRIRADERTRLVPVVVLTSSAEEEDLVRSYRLGANSYVRKPIDFEEFIEAIRQLSVYWFLLNRAP
jgi:two-component system, response regulator